MLDQLVNYQISKTALLIITYYAITMAVRFTILLVNTFSSLACMKNDELEKFNFTQHNNKFSFLLL